MLKAITNNKCRNYNYAEDCLTSTIFGAFRYLDINKGILSFFKKAKTYQNPNKSIEQDLIDNKIDINKYDDLKCYFWPKTNSFDEPDLICVFKDSSKTNKDLVFLIECKFKSSKSSDGDKDQLMRYYDYLHNKIENFNDAELSQVDSSLRYLIYLTQFEARLEIDESINAINKHIKDLNTKPEIFGLKWEDLFKVFEDYKEGGISKIENIIIDDLVEYMQVLGLEPFCGFKGSNLELDNLKCVFFNNKIKSYFSNVIRVEKDETIFFRRG